MAHPSPLQSQAPYSRTWWTRFCLMKNLTRRSSENAQPQSARWIERTALHQRRKRKTRGLLWSMVWQVRDATVLLFLFFLFHPITALLLLSTFQSQHFDLVLGNLLYCSPTAGQCFLLPLPYHSPLQINSLRFAARSAQNHSPAKSRWSQSVSEINRSDPSVRKIDAALV